MIILGLKCYSHDTGAAILSDAGGELTLYAISEARLNRRKHSFTYPLLSIAYCLSGLGLESLDQVDFICFDRHLEVWPEARSQFGYHNAVRRHLPRYDDSHRWNYLAEQTLKVDRSKVRWINHVDAHAASAFFVSPFDEAAILIAEGGTGIYRGSNNSITPVDRIGYLADTYQDGQKLKERRDQFVNSSFFYDKITSHLGYDIFGAGQTMALAGFSHRYPRKNHVEVDPKRFEDFIINHDRTVFGMNSTPKFEGEDPESLLEERWVNLARQAQETLEEDMLHLAWTARVKTGLRNLCIAGGAALNCIINRKIMDSGYFADMFIQPAASDEGIPLGCALYGYYANGGTVRRKMIDAYLGIPNDLSTLGDVIADWGLKSRTTNSKEIAKRLASGLIIGRVAGGAEYGPRALGNRSILADPRPVNMKDKINSKIKHRESFRPFAPSCLEDHIPSYLNSPRYSPFMVIAGIASETGRKEVPAVIHADGSCRVQTVSRMQNEKYYDLLEAFYHLTSCPVLLNTSFNDRNEPIVETYDDAISCFLRTRLDALYIEEQLIERTEDLPSPNRQEILEAKAAKVRNDYINLIEKFCDSEAYVMLAKKLKADEARVQTNQGL